jgi:AbiJ N-terminal domain 4
MRAQTWLCMPEPFSRRYRAVTGVPAPTIVTDAPTRVRKGVQRLATERMADIVFMRLVAKRLNVDASPKYDSGRYQTDYQGEAWRLLSTCSWFNVYDVVEDVYRTLEASEASAFSDEINDMFAGEGVALVLTSGAITPLDSQLLIQLAESSALGAKAAGLASSERELREAVDALSERPEPAYVRAARHVLAAFEATVRAAGDDPKSTPDEILARNPTLLPEPMKTVFSKTWGYASDKARHMREGGEIPPQEAAFVIQMAVAAVDYLARRVRVSGTQRTDR